MSLKKNISLHSERSLIFIGNELNNSVVTKYPVRQTSLIVPKWTFFVVVLYKPGSVLLIWLLSSLDLNLSLSFKINFVFYNSFRKIAKVIQSFYVCTPSFLIITIIHQYGTLVTINKPISTVLSNSATSWAVACQTPLSMGFPRQEDWSGLPFPSPGDPPDPGIEPAPPALAGRSLTTEPPGHPCY